MHPLPLYLAGGLRADNVAEAITTVQPHGLDLCSSVRSQGALDPGRLSAFSTPHAADGAPPPGPGVAAADLTGRNTGARVWVALARAQHQGAVAICNLVAAGAGLVSPRARVP